MILEINNLTKQKVDLALVKKVTNAFARAYKVGAKEISLAIVGDAAMKKLNLKYRGQNRPTDVLSFSGDNNLLGEIIIDYAQIKRQAGRFGQTARQELVFILVHGLLHLIGYDDRTEADRLKMVKLGEELVKNLKL